jgi:hypothetical protein
LEIEKSVVKNIRAAFSFSAPAAFVTLVKISRSRTGSATAPPAFFLTSATSFETESLSRKSFTSSSSMASIFLLAFSRSFFIDLDFIKKRTAHL